MSRHLRAVRDCELSEPQKPKRAAVGGAWLRDMTNDAYASTQRHGPDGRPRMTPPFIDQNGDAHAAVALQGGGSALLPVEDLPLGVWYAEDHSGVLHQQARRAVVDLIREQAQAIRVPVWLRVGPSLTRPGVYSYDIGPNSPILYTAGEWAPGGELGALPVVDTLFRATPDQFPQVLPEHGATMADLLSSVGNVQEKDWPLLAAFLVASMIPTADQMILDLTGPAGSGKSLLAEAIQTLVDPRANSLLPPPKSEQDVAAMARNAYLLSFDNLSAITPSLSDVLCRLATGGAIASRKLYTNHGLASFSARRPMILTSIVSPVRRYDLRDRSIRLSLEPLGGHRRGDRRDVLGAFMADMGAHFGALLTATTYTLARLPELKKERSHTRNPTFDAALVAMGELLQRPSVTSLAASRGGPQSDLVAADAVGAALVGIRSEQRAEGVSRWEVLAADCLRALAAWATNHGHEPERLPKTPEALRRHVNHLTEELGDQLAYRGVRWLGTKRTPKGVRWLFDWTDPQTSEEAGSAPTPTGRPC